MVVVEDTRSTGQHGPRWSRKDSAKEGQCCAVAERDVAIRFYACGMWLRCAFNRRRGFCDSGLTYPAKH